MKELINFGLVATTEIKEILSIIEELRETSSTNAKLAILEKNRDNEGLQTILERTYNPHKKYKVTEKTLVGGNGEGPKINNLRLLTHTLSESNINDKLRLEVNNFLDSADENIRDLYKGVLLKDLKIGVNRSLINKVWINLIPTSETGMNIKPMLADKFNFDKPPAGEYVVTEKLDGIRCLAVCTNDGVKLYSRQGKLIEGCTEVEFELRLLRSLMDKDFILDGELLAEDCDYENVYKETTKRVKNKKLIKTGIYLMVFDIIDLNEYNSGQPTTPYYKRLETLIKVNIDIANGFKQVKFIQSLYVGDDISRVLELLDEYKSKGAEGLMINLLDKPYELKRSKNILKVKVMQTADLKIIGFNKGKPNGKLKDTLGSIIVDYKGFEVSANIKGENNMAIREEIWNNQDKYLGKIAEISYFEETHDKEGNLSLRFPVFKWIREDKTEPSYY